MHYIEKKLRTLHHTCRKTLGCVSLGIEGQKDLSQISIKCWKENDFDESSKFTLELILQQCEASWKRLGRVSPPQLQRNQVVIKLT